MTFVSSRRLHGKHLIDCGQVSPPPHRLVFTRLPWQSGLKIEGKIRSQKRIKPSRRISSTIEIRFRWLRHEFLLLSTTVVGVIWESSTKFPWQKRALLIQPWELLSCLFRQLTWLFFEAQSEPESAANQQLVFLHVLPVSCLLLAKKRSCECD